MEFITPGPGVFGPQFLILLLVSLYYIGVVLSIIHLIFKTHYNLTERLLWMVVLWVIPLIGLVAYWIVWNRQKQL